MTKIMNFTFEWTLIGCCLLSLTIAAPTGVQKSLGFGVGFSAGLGVSKGRLYRPGLGLYNNAYGHNYNGGYYGYSHGPPSPSSLSLYHGYNPYQLYPYHQNPYINTYSPAYGHLYNGNHYSHHQAHHEIYKHGEYGHGNFFG